MKSCKILAIFMIAMFVVVLQAVGMTVVEESLSEQIGKEGVLNNWIKRVFQDRLNSAFIAYAFTEDIEELPKQESRTDELEPMELRYVTFESMLREMVDLKRLMYKPVHGESVAQASSYDRRSRIVEGERLEWFANGDAGNFIETINRNGRTEHVMAEIEGPGAIVRIWSANPKGVLRIYIDGSDTPALEIDFLRMLSGEGQFPFGAAFAGMRAAGGNSYVPIPFAESVLVTCENPGNLYYHIGYRLFPPGTIVESFAISAVEDSSEVIGEVAVELAFPHSRWTPEANVYTEEISLQIAPGEKKMLQFEGPAYIAAMELFPDAPDLDSMLRKTILSLTWDDADEPSVWAPLGDFFGSGPGFNRYESLPAGMLRTGQMYSHWIMPFEKKAVMYVENHTDEIVSITGEIIIAPMQWDDSIMHFHAKWKTEYPIHTDSPRDWVVIEVEGPGRFVGLSLSVANPVVGWWGEGDEKIYIDGESFPSFFGTGTEDYFGYAWCNPQWFSHAYHSQPRADGPANYGHISNNRFHIIDSIPFHKSFKFDLEVLHHVDTCIGLSAISYWYAPLGSRDSYEIPLMSKDIGIVELPPVEVE
jgi:hypothetical protein